MPVSMSCHGTVQELRDCVAVVGEDSPCNAICNASSTRTLHLADPERTGVTVHPSQPGSARMC